MNDTKQPPVSPGPGKVTLAGKTYLVGPATIGDVTAIRNDLRRALPDPLQALAELMLTPVWPKLSERTRLDYEREALQAHRAGGLTLTDEAAGALLEQPGHCAFALWVLARKHAPSLSLADVRKHVDEDNAAALLVDLHRESGLEALAPNRVGQSG